MSQLQSEFLQTMTNRGYVHQCTDLDALDALMASRTIPAYIGFDCTAASLHVGSLVQIMILRRLQQTGHKPIVLMGGGTTKIGDPSGKDDARKLLGDEQIEANKAGIQKIFARYLDFGDGPTDAVMVDNAEWLDQLAYIPFLRKYGAHFSVNKMLSFDSVRLRLEREQPLSFLEFNYMIMQAYDFLELRRRYGCMLQVGGSDQWGNIVNGVDLTRRVDQQTIFGLTTPLITLASGEKMGKTAQGAVWLNAESRSPYDFWQFWRNTEDADVGRFLRLFTDLPMAEIDRLTALQGAEINDAKKVLANAVTGLAHGAAAAQAAEETARKTFEEGELGAGLPTIDIDAATIRANLWIVDALRQTALASSNGEARRLIKGGGVRVNDQAVNDEQLSLGEANISAQGMIKLSVGKKRHALLRVVAES
jgi:tyrosyl-tRNA synthetase